MADTKKKILILTDWFYPGYKAGGPIQSCRNFIAAMHGHFDIHVITGDRDLGDIHPYSGITVNQWNDYAGCARVFYAAQLSLQQLDVLQRQLAPDFIYLNSMFSLRFTIFPLWLAARNRIQAQLVLAPRGMLHAGALQFKARKKKLFLGLIKTAGIQKKIRFHATDTQEAADIAANFPAVKNIVIATNFPRMQQPVFVAPEKKAGMLRCIFISRIAAKKNILYFLQLLKQLPPDIQLVFDIWGEVEDKAYWYQCTEQIKTMPPHVRVHLKGAVNNDEVPALLQQYHLFVLPTLGENFGHAIFEALLAGRPVLLSEHTPWRQLEQKKAGWDIPLHDKNKFTATIIKVAAMEAPEFNEWCHGAWQLANNFITHTDIRQQYLKLFN